MRDQKAPPPGEKAPKDAVFSPNSLRAEMVDVDAVVIGAGVVGLAVAAALAQDGREPLIIEKNRIIGEETSSRNSEVIHAGLYYPPGSLKGRLCVEGRERLYAWCAERGVAARRCGKLIVAESDADAPALERIAANARANGVDALEAIDGVAARSLEPALSAHAALHSPLTGVVDSHALMVSLLGAAEDHGATLAVGATVVQGAVGAAAAQGRTHLDVDSIDGPMRLAPRVVVNAAGLWAPKLASILEGLPSNAAPKAKFLKGNYFALTGARAPFSRLIYPTPQQGGLGVHLTLDLAGAARFGPDVEPLETDDPARIDYRVDAARGPAFEAAIRRYWPGLPDGALTPAYSGVRPKIDGDGVADFRIDGPADHGIDGLYNLFALESPALTASLAIAKHVAGRIARDAG